MTRHGTTIRAGASLTPSAAPTPTFRLGTRGSALALAQSGQIAAALHALGATVELVTIRTAGDDRPPDAIWGEGAFVGALESALLEGRIDLAVHSAKDVPTLQDRRLTIAAYPPREDPRDALVGREPGLTLRELPSGARVGTDSPRRSTFLRAVRPDLRLHPLHGNVDTRLRRLDSGETDALVLAVAGLTRLGRAGRIGERLAVDVLPPAPGQGSLALQCRAEDVTAREWLSKLDDPTTRIAVEAERAFLTATGGGCRAPLGALARIEEGELRLVAGSAGAGPVEIRDGERPDVEWGEVRGSPAGGPELARRLAAELTARLAAGPTRPARPTRPTPRPACPTPRSARTAARRGRVLITRPPAAAAPLAAALVERGFDPTGIATIAIAPVSPGSELDAALRTWSGRGWIAITSANGAGAILDAAARLDVSLSGATWAAVGDATRAALETRGISVAFSPSVASGAALAAELPLTPGTPVLLPRADLADSRLVDQLRARGAAVTPVTAYRTIEGPAASRPRLRAYFGAGTPDAIVFSSGSAVLGLLALLGRTHRAAALATLACCIGGTTAEIARAHGFARVVVGAEPRADAIADAVADALGQPVEATS